MTTLTSRCCAPSWRSRPSRRRSSSPALRMRARDAASCSRASVLASASVISWANVDSRVLGVGRQVVGPRVGGDDRAPQPARDHDRCADRRADPDRAQALRELVARARRSRRRELCARCDARAARPSRRRAAAAPTRPGRTARRRAPTRRRSRRCRRPRSGRGSWSSRRARSRPPRTRSSNTHAAGTSRATSVATRRSAACSCTSASSRATVASSCPIMASAGTSGPRERAGAARSRARGRASRRST